jgi:hypothetical protein
MNKDLGGPAFPNEGGHKFASGNDVRKTLPHPGMTLRDYFAAKASTKIATFIEYTGEGDTDYKFECSKWAAACYAFADAMLKERNK